MKFKLSIIALLTLIFAIGFAFLHTDNAPAPDSRFVLLDGSSKQMTSLRGQITLVNFWATSCASCVAEMPALISTYEKYRGKGFSTVAVAMQYDPPSYVVNFSKSRQLPFDVAIDNSGVIAKEWGKVQLTPTTFIVDKKGNIVKKYVGTPDFADLHRLIEKLLTETT